MDAAVTNARLDQLVAQIEHVEPGVARHLDGIGADPYPRARHRSRLQRHVLADRLIEVGLRPGQRIGSAGLARLAPQRVGDLAGNVVEAADAGGRVLRESRRSQHDGEAEPTCKKAAERPSGGKTSGSGEERSPCQQLGDQSREPPSRNGSNGCRILLSIAIPNQQFRNGCLQLLTVHQISMGRRANLNENKNKTGILGYTSLPGCNVVALMLK